MDWLVMEMRNGELERPQYGGFRFRGRRERNGPGRRCRPAVVHAVGLQLYGLGRAADRYRRDAGVQQRLYRFADRQPADVGGDARAAGVCAGAELWHQQALDRRRTGAVLGLCRSEEHTSELQSLMRISYAVFCLKKKTHKTKYYNTLHS